MDPRLTPPQGRQQRFSWQPSAREEQVPPYEPPQQPLPQADATANPHNRTFSYAQTPIEHRDPYYATQNHPALPLPLSPSTPSSAHPQPIYTTHNPPTQHQSQQAYFTTTPYSNGATVRSPVSPQEVDHHNFPVPPQSQSTQFTAAPYTSGPRVRSPVSPVSVQAAKHPPPFSPVSPIHAPQQLPQTNTAPPNNHARKLSNLTPLNINFNQQPMPPVPQIPQRHLSEADPLPPKTPISPISSGPIKHSHTRSDPFTARAQTNRQSQVPEPYSPHGFATAPTTHAVFSPHAAHGPNGLDFALHQPGQITHPNMTTSSPNANKRKPSEWSHSLCACTPDISTCLTGLFCPCILYGRTSYRLARKSEKKDPTDMLGYSATNGHCGVMGAACVLGWLFPMIQRTRVRHAYKIEGSLLGDVVRGCCCCCCVAVLNEREVRGREESARQWAGPAGGKEAYGKAEVMAYSAQR